MDLNKTELDELYSTYGFKKRSASSDNIRVYTYRSGYFNNADIIPLIDSADPSKDFEEFQKAGFACTIREYKSIKDAERDLFEGFFALDSTKKRFYEEEKKFSARQSNLIGAKYRYISPPYREVYQEKKQSKQNFLVDHLIEELGKPGPRLMILEAAAGYGKTCSSFELLKKALDHSKERLPFFIELSRNRQAKIFRYVLLDEIDRVFPSLSANLVESQIEKGSVFLIVDGFDELLHRTEAVSPDYDKVEPMLETLSDLLKGDAKVVLTTRKTAIFSGDHFHTWMENHEDDFAISRYSLLKPNIEDWLCYDRRYALEEASFPIESLSNPVLLAFLAGQGDSEFEYFTKHPEKIVENYFVRLLDREKERQELIMDIEEQYQLYTGLAGHMLELDFTAEDHEYLQLYIVENNNRLLSQVRSRYPAESRPTLEELSAKLVSHALLDRKGEESDRVGFVNDFVLGNFIGETVLASDSNELIIGEGFLEQAASSYRPRARSERIKLWQKLKFSLEFIPSENRVSAEISLCGRPAHDLCGETFSGVMFENTILGGDGIVETCVFADCTFNKVEFSLENFNEVTFVGCNFYSCLYAGEKSNISGSIYLAGCTGDIESFTKYLGYREDRMADTFISDVDLHKKSVLEQFWPVGRSHFRSKRQILTLYKGHSNRERGLVTEAISSLQHDEILVIKGDTANINPASLKKIREILGR